MNKVMLMGRLTRDPEVRYSQSANPVAVRRQFKKQGEPDVDFFNIVAFGKAAEFVQKHFRKGHMIMIVGRLQVSTWEDNNKVKHISIDVVTEEQHFCGEKHSSITTEQQQPIDAFMPPTVEEDDDLPFLRAMKIEDFMLNISKSNPLDSK